MGSKKTRLASASGSRVSGKRTKTETTAKKKPKQANKKGGNFWDRLSPAKRALVVLASVLALAGVLAALVWTSISSAIRPPEITPPPNNPTVAPPDVSRDPADPSAGPEDVVSTRKDGMYTVLVMGHNYGLTDVMMMMNFDTANGRIEAINIPRDTYSNDITSYPHKINSAYNEGGIEQVYEAVEGVIGFRPDKYVMVDYEGFVAVVDTLEGVEFDVPQNMYHVADDGTVDINLRKGYQTLNGRQALGLVRFRSGYADQDLGRIRTLQKFLVAAAQKMVDTISFSKISDYVNICIDYIETDLTAGEIIWFVQQAFSVDMDTNLTFHTPELDAYTYKGASYVFLREESMVELVNSTVNPLSRDLTVDDLDIFNPREGANTVTGTSTDGESGSGGGSTRPAANTSTPKPSAAPSSDPSAEPSSSPSASSSPRPGSGPSTEPPDEPSEEPTDEPSEEPSEEPSDEPSDEPTDEPSAEPSDEPSEQPTEEPEPSEEPFVPATPEP